MMLRIGFDEGTTYARTFSLGRLETTELHILKCPESAHCFTESYSISKNGDFSRVLLFDFFSQELFSGC